MFRFGRLLHTVTVTVTVTVTDDLIEQYGQKESLFTQYKLVKGQGEFVA
jgi:hypothetical protein